MKKRTLIILLVAAALYAPFNAYAKKLGTSIGLEYRSEYFWRGQSFYGSFDGNSGGTRGVFFPWIGQALGDFYISISGEVASAALNDNLTNVEKAWYGVDFMASWTKTFIDDQLKLKIHPGYYMYPKSAEMNNRKEDGGKWRNDFFDAAFTISLPKVLLNPSLTYSHYLRIDDRSGTQDNLEDIYIKFAISHTFTASKMASVTVGGWVAYFHYPSSRQWGDYGNHTGFSDVVAYVKANVKVTDSVSLGGSFNLAWVPDKSHYEISGADNRIHTWSTFSATYSL